MTQRCPKAKDAYSDELRNKLSKGQEFITSTGGRIKFKEIRPGREPDGRTTFTAVFDVVESDESGFVFGASYTTTEYLALHRISTGALQPVS